MTQMFKFWLKFSLAWLHTAFEWSLRSKLVRLMYVSFTWCLIAVWQAWNSTTCRKWRVEPKYLSSHLNSIFFLLQDSNIVLCIWQLQFFISVDIELTIVSVSKSDDTTCRVLYNIHYFFYKYTNLPEIQVDAGELLAPHTNFRSGIISIDRHSNVSNFINIF